MNNKQALDALMHIEGLHSLNSDIKSVINKSEAIKRAKKYGKENTRREKELLTEKKNTDSCVADTGKIHQACNARDDFHVFNLLL